MSKRYWVAHVRGPDYNMLKRRGFLVLYPDVDDYVFLEVKPENQKLLKKQLELCVAFLKNRKGFQTVSEEEVQRMRKKTTAEQLEIGTQVEVIAGFCENMEGEVLEVEGEKIKLRLQGYNRTYEQIVDRLDVIAKQKEEQVA